ncbi:hypothetical protein [Paenibacillus glacialis]|uniref:Uncharacterized protein n=1 Tax=Paenibacillus glacialis TaxID=494026 RepID=A0A162K3F3_9BACL|nr:hypothetical protein [Paenibacillus glacialis]OAB42496.1 hypothetical protein PGLA_12595 [Paenibacillus glacialis]
MELISQKVMHIRFGEGFVVSNTDNRIDVQFAEPLGQKGFTFPDAFVQHLWMHDPAVQEFVIAQYYQNQKQIEAEKQRQEEEREVAAEAARELAASKRKSSTKKKK